MQGSFTERIMGLTEGTSSRFMRANRSHLVMYQSQIEKQRNGSELHGRLEELLVFEIMKDGDASYHRFTVRGLHKYVLSAIRTGTVESRKQESATKDTDRSENVTYREKLGGYLHPRDMRKLVTPFSTSNEPELIVRRHAMLLNFDPLRAIILRDRLLVLVPDGADSILVQLERRVRGMSQNPSKDESVTPTIRNSESNMSLNEETGNCWDQSFKQTRNGSYRQLPKSRLDQPLSESDETESEKKGSTDSSDPDTSPATFIDNEWDELEGKEWIDLPFELQSVDAVLASVASILADDVMDLQMGANAMISDVINPRADVGDHAQEVLRILKNSVKELMSRVDGYCRALETLLEDYEDMTLMNLSRLLSHPELFVQPVPQSVLDEESDEPELILEAHLQRGHTLNNGLTLVQGQIQTTEDFAVRKSENLRNRLLYINLLISVFSLAVTMCSLVGSIFGMNIINHQEESPTAFKTIVWSTALGGFCFSVLMIAFIRWTGTLPSLM